MSTKRIVGIGLLIVGLGLLFFGFQATDTLTEEVHETLTGRFTDETTWYLIGGAAAAVVGLLLTLFGGKR
ncbi:DUF3185 family protein [Wenzhouxiangella sp. AB-CW3]|uniref:DUF3185 family protein n=1 Tax=Wenzhouxiangella sp. AB-CW3 TaxID=2771012 RepID=UPI00168B3BAC|nr:DUF3185 family protein [Wenzhouxiangella sp. AB-CW3]QOC22625.1 DUF3185 family protein [Wenzhouxiangella sp. AB-CW3]